MQIHKNILVRVDRDDLDGNGAFVVPEDVKEIGCTAFMFCNKDLRDIIIPEGVEGIESFAFYECENISQINLPTTMKNIGELAFFNCYNLKGVELPEGVKRIGNGAFTSCVLLDTVIIPESVDKIGTDLFYGCGSLKRLALPKKFKNNMEDILGPYVTSNNDLEILLTEPEKTHENGEFKKD